MGWGQVCVHRTCTSSWKLRLITNNDVCFTASAHTHNMYTALLCKALDSSHFGWTNEIRECLRGDAIIITFQWLNRKLRLSSDLRIGVHC